MLITQYTNSPVTVTLCSTGGWIAPCYGCHPLLKKRIKTVISHLANTTVCGFCSIKEKTEKQGKKQITGGGDCHEPNFTKK